MIQPHQTPTTPDAILAASPPTADFPCVLRLHREDPCKGWLLEIHTAWTIDFDHPLQDDDGACAKGSEWVRRFVEIGLASLGDPDCMPGMDWRIRLMGDSGDWAMFEFTSMDPAALDAAVARFSAAYGRTPFRRH